MKKYILFIVFVASTNTLYTAERRVDFNTLVSAVRNSPGHQDDNPDLLDGLMWKLAARRNRTRNPTILEAMQTINSDGSLEYLSPRPLQAAHKKEVIEEKKKKAE